MTHKLLETVIPSQARNPYTLNAAILLPALSQYRLLQYRLLQYRQRGYPQGSIRNQQLFHPPFSRVAEIAVSL